MAIGIAKIFGFHFPPNFARPYLASSITAFWRRWHISLSTWLRDYLYIPLGGNRASSTATYQNLMITMLLGGLWHGASWNFVIWGGYHGALLAIERFFRGTRKPDQTWSLLYPIQALLTFFLVMLGWVFFRAPDFSSSMQIIGYMFRGFHGHLLFTAWHEGLILTALAIALLEEKADLFNRVMSAPLVVRGTALGLMLFCLEIFGVIDTEIPFVYFQF